MQAISSVLAVFPECTQNIPQYVIACRTVVSSMTANVALFANPMPPLAEVSSCVDTLDAAQILVVQGVQNATEQRNVALGQTHARMRLLKAYVQSIADTTPGQASFIITSAGMQVSKPRARNKRPVSVKYGETPGSLVLEAKALPQPVQYRWQMSTDEQTWTDLPETFKAKTIVDGLTPTKVYYFRLRTITRKGTSDWSSAVSIIAH